MSLLWMLSILSASAVYIHWLIVLTASPWPITSASAIRIANAA